MSVRMHGKSSHAADTAVSNESDVVRRWIDQVNIASAVGGVQIATYERSGRKCRGLFGRLNRDETENAKYNDTPQLHWAPPERSVTNRGVPRPTESQLDRRGGLWPKTYEGSQLPVGKVE